MQNFESYLNRKRASFGEEFDPSNLSAHLVPFYESGERIEVKTAYGEIKRGRIGITTGWRPVFLLMPRVDSIGSSETLTPACEVLRVVSQ